MSPLNQSTRHPLLRIIFTSVRHGSHKNCLRVYSLTDTRIFPARGTGPRLLSRRASEKVATSARHQMVLALRTSPCALRGLEPRHLLERQRPGQCDPLHFPSGDEPNRLLAYIIAPGVKSSRSGKPENRTPFRSSALASPTVRRYQMLPIAAFPSRGPRSYSLPPSPRQPRS